MKHRSLVRSRTWSLGFTVLVMALAAACSSAVGHAGSAATQAVSFL